VLRKEILDNHNWGVVLPAIVSKEETQSVQLKTPPGPPVQFFIGSAREALRNPLAFNLKYWKQYGDYLKFHALPGMTWYMFTDPSAVEHILQTHQQKYQKPSRFKDSFGLLGGKGLLTSDGDYWLKQRRLIQPAFHRERMMELGSLMTQSIEEQIADWEERDANAVVDVFQEMMTLTLKVVGRTLFGAELGDQAERFREALDLATAHIADQVSSIISFPTWVPTSKNRHFCRNKAILDDMVYGIIEHRRATTHETGDLLDMLMNVSDADSGSAMSNDQLRDEVITLLISGHETLAISLSWCFYLLAQNPVQESVLLDELSSVLGGRAATMADLPRLPYNKMVFEEALRLYPPIWGQPREAREDDAINGYAVPKGATVSVCQFITHRHPLYWQNPQQFMPERFMPEVEAQRPKFAYYPFGGGGRTCIANNMAMIEGQLALATIAQRLKFELVPGHLVEPDPKCTLRPKYGIKAHMQRRS